MSERPYLTAKILENELHRVISYYFASDEPNGEKTIALEHWKKPNFLQAFGIYAKLVCHNETINEMRKNRKQNQKPFMTKVMMDESNDELK